MLEGKLIVFEGVDGVGKSSQMQLLGNALKTKGFDVILGSTPSATYRQNFYIKKYNETGKSDLSINTIAMMATCDRMEYIDLTVVPHLRHGGIAILDRYIESAVAYFENRGASSYATNAMRKLVRPADLGFLLVTSHQTRQTRILSRGKTSDWEENQPMHLDRIQQTMLSQVPENYYLIDASLNMEDTHMKILACMDKK